MERIQEIINRSKRTDNLYDFYEIKVYCSKKEGATASERYFVQYGRKSYPRQKTYKSYFIDMLGNRETIYEIEAYLRSIGKEYRIVYHVRD